MRVLKQQDLIKFAEDTFTKCLTIMKAKNHDYSVGEDALRNFKTVNFFGVDPKDGFVTRMTDKLMRVGNLIHHSAKVKDERIEDTLLDLINYSMLFLAYLETLKDESSKK